MAEVEPHAVGIAARVAREGEHYDGQAALPRVDELSQALREAGAEVYQRHRRVEIDLGVARRHRRHAALVQGEDAVNVGVLVEGVEERRLPATRSC